MAVYQQRPGFMGNQGNPFLHAQFGDTSETKLFVGGLAWETQSEFLRRYFEPYGEILEAVVITDRITGRSKGYGFVTFRDPESARRACADPNPVIEGRRANCNLAAQGRLRPPPPLYGRMRPTIIGSIPAPRGNFVGSQQHVSYGYPPGVVHPYGYAVGPDYIYQQNVYNPYAGNPYYYQLYNVASPYNTMYPISPLGQSPSGGSGYGSFAAYSVPGSHIIPLGGATVSGVTSPHVSAAQPPFSPSQVLPQAHYVIPTPQYSQGAGGPEQATG